MFTTLQGYAADLFTLSQGMTCREGAAQQTPSGLDRMIGGTLNPEMAGIIFAYTFTTA